MSEKSRIYGLDAARAILLVYGPLIHAIIPGHRTPLIHTIDEGSHLFRMAAFFAVAGYLVALNAKTSKPGWLKDRFRQLFVPLCTMTCILYSLKITIGNTDSDVAVLTKQIPFHLWFLIVLLIISPITLFLDKRGASDHLSRFFEKHPFTFIGLALVLTFLTKLSLVSSEHYGFLSKAPVSVLIKIVLFQAPAYFVFYMLGFFLCRAPKVTSRLNNLPVIILGFVLFAISLTYFNLLIANHNRWTDVRLVRLTYHGMSTLTEVFMSVAVISLALRVKSIHRSVSWFSSAAYTVYLVHVPIIFVIAYVTLEINSAVGPYYLYGLLASISLVISYSVHYFVSRSSLFLFLFNGKKLVFAARPGRHATYQAK